MHWSTISYSCVAPIIFSQRKQNLQYLEYQTPSIQIKAFYVVFSTNTNCIENSRLFLFLPVLVFNFTINNWLDPTTAGDNLERQFLETQFRKMIMKYQPCSQADRLQCLAVIFRGLFLVYSSLGLPLDQACKTKMILGNALNYW